MELLVLSCGLLIHQGTAFHCALGRGGVTSEKREGDGATPVGRFALRELLYRADRGHPPQCRLPTRALQPADGWSDDPADELYNRAVTLPHPARHEQLWRDDALYDLIVPLGYNDDPPVAGRGSAIFLHVAADDFGPTEGCVALARADLMQILRDSSTQDYLRIIPPPDSRATGHRR